MLNKVALVGRMTKDADLKYLKNGTAVANFTIAVNRNFKNRNDEVEADFIKIVAFGKQSENIAKYTEKGSLISVSGRIQTRNYKNSEGKTVYITEVIADEICFLDSKKKKDIENDFNNLEQDLPF